MRGLMQDAPLLISSIITHAARHHAAAEVVSRTTEGTIHRYRYPECERRARRLVRVLQRLGVRAEDRVATLAWNGFRHLELYYAVSGMGAVIHTVNPRLAADDVAYIVEHAGDGVIFADTTFAALIATVAPQVRQLVRAVVFMAERAHMPDIALPAGMDLLCYEELMDAADEDFAWPVLDERSAAGLCYTSGTTGRPKGVLYSHRSTLLHAYAVNTADVLGFRATDRALPVVPMFHVNAWGIPYAAPMVGASLVMPGRYLDGPSLTRLMNDEAVTFSSGVPTVWLGLLAHLQASGERLTTVRQLTVGGSACPRLLFEEFGAMGITVGHGWGMTEMSPVGTYNTPKAGNVDLAGEAAMRLKLKQGRVLFGVDMKVVDDAGRDLAWDGATSGHLLVRGPWVTSAYYGAEAGSAVDADGWFDTGDVAAIDPEGYLDITDRSKDVIKSGGEWISSIALENIAVGHPDVAEAAIIAARHEKWTERPLLIVVPKPGREIDKAEMLAIYDGKVAKWWVPDDVVVVHELPHSATGKIQKLALRAQWAGYLVTDSQK
jgi:acyl-CoA synthetase (AMP-forming)/AMP-acid ligase II